MKDIKYLDKPTEILDEAKAKAPNVASMCVWWIEKDGTFAIRSFMQDDEAALHMGICEIVKAHILDTYQRGE